MKIKKSRIGTMKQVQQPQKYTPEWTAQHAKRAMDYLSPLIREKKISPIESLILTFCLMDHNITGKTRSIPQDEIIKGTQLVMALWEEGLFTPCATYPHTVEQTLIQWNKETEDRSEAE